MTNSVDVNPFVTLSMTIWHNCGCLIPVLFHLYRLKNTTCGLTMSNLCERRLMNILGASLPVTKLIISCEPPLCLYFELFVENFQEFV